MLPQEGRGGCAPIPKKLSPLSINNALAKFVAQITVNGPIVFGNISLKMM